MKIKIIPCLKDNYSYLLIDDINNTSCVIDPSEATPIAEILDKNNIKLDFILNTHHHYDHVGGNKKLKESLKEVMSLVREGAELGRSLGKVDQFSPLLVQLISTGEKSGELIGMLEVVSTQLTNQLKQKALRFTVFIEPLMILFMGGIVLLIVLAVMMPLIEMNSML